MTPLEKAQKEAIIRRISFIEVELNDLAEFKDLKYETYRQNRSKRRNVERIAENIANAVIDIGKIALAGESIDTPGTYREIFLRMYELAFISQEVSDKLGDIARTRNILAHQYLDVKWERLQTFLEESPAIVTEFIRTVQDLFITPQD